MTRRVLDRWVAAFRASGPSERAAAHGTAVAIAGYLAIFGLYSQWYIEDAAIVFGYARNAAEGLGFVPWPGGERVEGFSDPLWTLALTLLAVVRISPWIAVKILGAALGAATLVGVARLARAVAPDADPRWSAAAAGVVAVSPQFASWNASGLENPLFSALIVGGALSVLDRRPPAVSGAWWGLVAITRPEGLMYGAVAGAAGLALAGRGAPVWAVGFGAGVAAPLAGWMAFKLPYFAWPLPNTYYAKLGELQSPLGAWDAPGWHYVRDWGLRTGQAFLLPLYALGLAGEAPGPRRAALGWLAVAGVLWVPGLAWTAEIPGWPLSDVRWLATARIAWFTLGLFALPLLGVGRPGWPARLLVAYLAGAGLFFSVYSGGDWMIGFRWMAVPALGLGILLADAVRVWDPRLPPALRAVAAVGVAGVLLGAGGAEIVRSVRSADTSPFDVHDRVRHHARIGQKLGLDLPPRIADVDMGAHLWWYREPVADYAGLLDVAFAQQHWDPRFLDEYVYGGLRPEILHVHGNWSSRSRLRSRPGFAAYVAVPGYPQSLGVTHEGSAIRRELLTGDWRGPPGREARFAGPKGAAILVGWDAPPAVAPGGPLPVRTAWRREGGAPSFQVTAFLSDEAGVRATWELPPAWGWFPAEKWRAGETVVTRHLPVVPADLPPGTYDLGLVVVGRPGPVWPGPPSPAGAAYATGEVLFPDAIVVDTPDRVRADADAIAREAGDLAAGGDCEAAAAARAAARDLLGFDAPVVAALRVSIGRCLVARGTAQGASDAVRWAPTDPVVRDAGARLADRWEREGHDALATGDREVAHRRWTEALAADPLRPWLRRALETLRRERLGLGTRREPPPPADPAQRGG